MYKSKLISLLKSFSPEEIKDFGLYLHSGLFNREKAPAKLFKLLKLHYPEFESEKINKKKIFKGLFSGRNFNDDLLRNTVSDLMKLAEEFLILIHNRSEPFLNHYYLLKELTNRKQPVLFNMNLRDAETLLKKAEIRDEIHYQHKFLIEDERRRNVVVNSSRILYKEDNLNSQAANLHIQHLIENIKLYAIMLNQKKFTHDHNFDFTFFEIIIEYVRSNYEKFRDIPYIKAFYNCVMIFKTEENIYFSELKKIVEKNYKVFSLTDRKNLFIVLTAHVNSKIRKGDFSLLEERFELYREFIRTGAYYEGNSFMAHYIYSAAALSAVEINKTDWAEKFINKYKPQLHEDFRDNTFNYCMSVLNLYKSDYGISMEYLSKVKTIDIAYRNNVNILLLKIYFCQRQTDSLYSLIDSYRHFLKRSSKIRKEDAEFNNNFLKYLKKVYQILVSENKFKKYDLTKIKNELEATNNISSKKWILDQINNHL